MSSNEGSTTSANDKPGCLGRILSALGLEPKAAGQEVLSYHVRDDFLSSVERNFYHVLRMAVGDWAIVCPKVSMGDLFYAESSDHSTWASLRNRIAQRHVDFTLCDPRSMQPLLGIELDDSSHSRASRQERDTFVDQVFAAAGLPLFRQPARAAYDVRSLGSALCSLAGRDRPPGAEVSPPQTVEELPDASPPEAGSPVQPASSSSSASSAGKEPPLCPKCGQPMVLRTVKKEGPYKGRLFWGCPSYPRCRGIRDVVVEDGG